MRKHAVNVRRAQVKQLHHLRIELKADWQSSRKTSTDLMSMIRAAEERHRRLKQRREHRREQERQRRLERRLAAA
jgi:hypothetical protein